MKLLLTSEGLTNISIANTLSKLIGNSSMNSAVIHVPTAANGEPEEDKGWVQTQIAGFRTHGFSTVDIIDISQAKKSVWLPLLEKAQIISFGGGNTKYLLEQLHKSGCADELPRLLETRVYVGMSAGSMVTSKILSLSDEGLLYYDSDEHSGMVQGLGLLDFEIRPHLNSPDFPKVRLDYLEKLSKENPTPFYAIDDNSAVVVDGLSVSVVSEGVWQKFN